MDKRAPKPTISRSWLSTATHGAHSLKSSLGSAALNPHVQTMLACISVTPLIGYTRETINTPDRDFLDLDWMEVSSKKLAIISHGIEGNSQSSYIRPLVGLLVKSNISVIAWNFRGCSGRLNALPKNYHGGLTQDLELVVKTAISRGYTDITLIGFSLGGNLALRYCAERGRILPTEITRVIALSVPCDLEDAAQTIIKSAGGAYNRYIVNLLKHKARRKARAMPGEYPDIDKIKVRTVEDFDNLFTAPHFGFKDARDYWKKASCLNVLEDITVPSWIISAQDDPFFSKASIPFKEASNNPYLKLIVSTNGGHLGFFSSITLARWTDALILSLIGVNGNSSNSKLQKMGTGFLIKGAETI